MIFIKIAEAAQAGASACSNSNLTGGIDKVIGFASCVLMKMVVPLLFSLATLTFIWGVYQYFINPDNETKREKGKGYMLWSLIGLFVMLSMWGIVAIFTDTFGLSNAIPQLSQ
jgi:hypothetical protein